MPTPKRVVPQGSTHRHDMRATDDPAVLKCSSCQFRCADDQKTLRLVNQRPDLHMVVTKRSPADLQAVFHG